MNCDDKFRVFCIILYLKGSEERENNIIVFGGTLTADPNGIYPCPEPY